MLDRILNFLNGKAPQGVTAAPDQLQLAVAALLAEAAIMDQAFDAEERRTVERLLAERFALSPEETQTLLAEAEKAVHETNQLFGFTRVIVQQLDETERLRIIEMLWEVAYADGHLDSFEDNLIRRVGGLIHVADRDRGLARHRALQRLGIEA